MATPAAKNNNNKVIPKICDSRGQKHLCKLFHFAFKENVQKLDDFFHVRFLEFSKRQQQDKYIYVTFPNKSDRTWLGLDSDF